MEIIDVHVHGLSRGEMCGGEVDARIDTVLGRLRNHDRFDNWIGI